MSIVAANQLLRSNQPVEALVALLDAWRAVRSSRLANLIDHVSSMVESTVVIPGKSVGERDDAWREIARRKQPIDLPRLLRTPWPKQWRGARARLDLLDRWPDDPRLVAALVRTAMYPPYESLASLAFYELLFAKIGRLADLRSLPALHELLARKRWLSQLAPQPIAALERAFPHGEPVIAPEDEEALDEIGAHYADQLASEAASAARGAELLAAIYEVPDDDGARAVYGDWLVERGDPRGELIALQLARARGTSSPRSLARERALLDAHGRTWAGALGGLFDSDSHVFDRGFFAGGLLRVIAIDPLRGDPAVRLLREITRYGSADVVIELLEYVPALRALSVSASTAARIATRREPHSLTRLVCAIDHLIEVERAALASCPALPALRELEVYCRYPGHVSWLASAPLLDRIERLAILGLNMISIAELVDRPSTLRELVIFPSSWRATLRRDTTATRFSTCLVECLEKRGNEVIADLARTLERIPTGLTRLEIVPGRHVLGPEARSQLGPALERFAGTELVIPWHEPAPAA